MPIFTASEINRRWQTLWDTVPDVDAILAPSFHNSYYLSGFPMLKWGRHAITILIRDGAPVLVVPDFEEEAAALDSPIEDVRLYRDMEGPSVPTSTAMATDVLKSAGVRRVGIEAGGMPAAMYLQMASSLAAATFIEQPLDAPLGGEVPGHV